MKNTNNNDLRDIILESLGRMRKGKSNAAEVNALSGAVRTIVNTHKMDLEYSKAMGHSLCATPLMLDAPSVKRALK